MTTTSDAPRAEVETEAEETRAEVSHAPTRVVLVRHGVTEQTGPLLSGRLPGIALSEKGIEQAEEGAGRLAGLAIAAVYASPIERTPQTAQCIAARLDLPVIALDGVI